MRNDLDLSVPGRNGRSDRPSRPVMIMLATVIAILLALVAVFGMNSERRGASRSGLSAKKLEALALKFENQKLPEAAARAWTEYAGAARLSDKEAARIWFRVGKLHQEANAYEQAIEAYYRSEALAALPELEPEIGTRTAECLEAMGKFAALDRVLAERTSIPGMAGGDAKGEGDVLVEIGTWKITRSDLDVMIEAEVDAQLNQMSAGLTGEEKAAQKKKILEGIQKQGERERWLQQFVAEELLYRYAREQKLHEDPAVRALARNLERKVLAQTLMDREFARRITMTPEEVRAYYDGHTDEFKKDDKVQPFEQVKDQAAAALRYQKAMEVQQQVLGQLRDKYDVVIHTSKLGGK
ncbi:MAG: hypothetical protein C4574_02030 [Candidatus Latescibacterota bacterium]|nr:MAG: hypothetical protein C4574_02030 [Candidatus Latescibacterota bacterium]